MKFSIIVWGIGEIYNKHVNTLKWLEQKAEAEVIALTAKGYSFLDNLDGYPVVEKEEIKELEFDYIIIMSENSKNDIIDEALELGISREKLLSYKILDLPDFNFKEYINLKNSRISIISNNCWGGIIYATLGLECLSPFKNLFIEESQYIQLLRDMKYYLQCPLKFSRFAIDRISNICYPVMDIGGLEIHCNHYTDPDEAREMWDKRYKKINWDNLFIVMKTESRRWTKKFLDIEYEKKMCFVPFKSDDKNTTYLRGIDTNQRFGECVNINAGIGNGSYRYNLIRLLLGNSQDVLRSQFVVEKLDCE